MRHKDNYLIEEGISWLQKAVTYLKSTQAFKDLAQTYLSLATASEELGRVARCYLLLEISVY